jgi:hypothetical protein
MVSNNIESLFVHQKKKKEKKKNEKEKYMY